MHRPRLPARSHLQQPKYIAMGFGYCPATGCGIARIVMTINRQGSYPLHVTKYVTGRFSSMAAGQAFTLLRQRLRIGREDHPVWRRISLDSLAVIRLTAARVIHILCLHQPRKVSASYSMVLMCWGCVRSPGFTAARHKRQLLTFGDFSITNAPSSP